MTKLLWRSFREGFVGSFVLAWAIVMAVASVAAAFSVGGADALRRDNDRAAHT